MDQTAPLLDNFNRLKDKIHEGNLPADLVNRLSEALDYLQRLAKGSNFGFEFDRELKYIEFVSALPFNRSSQDILDLRRAKQILDRNHYGLEVVKERILEYLAVLILNAPRRQQLKSQILAFVGLVGSGKTSLAYSIAESLGRKIIRIPFGGLGSVSQLRGQSKSSLDAEPGYLMKSIKAIGENNPVILLDEIDRVAGEVRSDIMGVLVELLDPEQNFAFVDHYIDYPFDLSKALFITTANNISNIATAVLDRLEVIEMPSYSDQEKIMIGRQYLLPRAIEEANLNPQVISIDEGLWPQIVRPLGFDGGVRSLQRNIQSIVRKIAKEVVEGNPGPYHLSAENIRQYVS